MMLFEQIGWFNPGSRRFDYTDVVDDMVKRGRSNEGYTHPVFAIDPETSSRLSVQLESARHAPQLRQPAICPCFIDGAGCVIQETTMLCYGKPCVLDRGKQQAGG